ncbi:hypothetical protein MJK72_22155 [Klebsiella pneumoniae]|nr:hypothetical protein MJK72_22155 [Klebsiella pneumoniae]
MLGIARSTLYRRCRPCRTASLVAEGYGVKRAGSLHAVGKPPPP